MGDRPAADTSDLLARFLDKLATSRYLDHNEQRFTRQAAAALRAAEAELATARTQIARLVDNLLAIAEARPDFTDVGRLQRQAVSALTATGLASVSPPADREGP